MEGNSSTCVVPRSELIARLNDDVRRRGEGGTIMVTSGVRGLAGYDAAALFKSLATYDAFDADNDPHASAIFGAPPCGGPCRSRRRP